MIKENLKLFFYWINERHKIWMRREAGKKWPWTKDEILQQYKFVNVFRELDAVTVSLHDRVDNLANSLDPWDRVYHIILYRAFNWPPTYDALMRANAVGKYKRMLRVLEKMSTRGEKIFTGAYIITNAGQNAPKHELMADAMDVVWRARKRIWESVLDLKTMEGVTVALTEYPSLGMFTAYEVTCDMRWQKGLVLENAPDLLTWANLGPGARRGINRIWVGDPKTRAFKTVEEYVEAMRKLWSLGVDKRRLGGHVLSARHPFEMREVEHSLCEFDKYMRVRNGEGRPRSKYTAPPW